MQDVLGVAWVLKFADGLPLRRRSRTFLVFPAIEALINSSGKGGGAFSYISISIIKKKDGLKSFKYTATKNDVVQVNCISKDFKI